MNDILLFGLGIVAGLAITALVRAIIRYRRTGNFIFLSKVDIKEDE